MAADTVRLGFLGAGNMATALARGWIDAGLATPERVLASDPMPAAREPFAAVTRRGPRSTTAKWSLAAICWCWRSSRKHEGAAGGDSQPP